MFVNKVLGSLRSKVINFPINLKFRRYINETSSTTIKIISPSFNSISGSLISRNFVTSIQKWKITLHNNINKMENNISGSNIKKKSNIAIGIHRRMLSSTVKKRRMKMNKHKLKKRRKALRMNTKISRS